MILPLGLSALRPAVRRGSETERLRKGGGGLLVTTGGIPNMKREHPVILHPREQTWVRPSGAEL
jgi:hypothetical protein